MFEAIQERFYQSLVKSIKDRKKILGLKREDMLRDPTRVSKILKVTRNGHFPNVICKGEYAYLNYLFLCEDHDSFEKENILYYESKEHEEKNGKNYDKMLWGHIDWDAMFRNVITELSEFDISEEYGKLFEDTLVDYAPYAVIRYDELCPGYGCVFISPDERKEKRQKAIERVHLGRGKELFRQTFLEKFSGKTLREFDKDFDKFISDYLKRSKPNDHSLGLQAYNFHKNLSKFVVDWQNLPEVQYADMTDKKLDLETLLYRYRENGWEQMQKLIKFQQEFDNLHVDIK